MSSRSILEIGAIGDGKTDNSACFAHAIANRAKWFIPAGHFLVTSNHVLLHSNSFEGLGSILFQGQLFPIGSLQDPITVVVPTQFPTIQEAIDYGASLQITREGSITVQILDGTYSCQQVSSTIIGGSSKLFIRGNESQPSQVVLNFDATDNKNGFFADGDTGFAWINGVTINAVDSRHVPTNKWNDQCYGAAIRAINSSSIRLGGAVVINHFYYGVSARYSASIVCNPGVVVNSAGDCGFHAFAATISCIGCFAYYCSDGHLGFGFCSESGGFIDCSESTTAFNNIGGIYANGAHLWAHSSISHDNVLYGYYALNGGHIECTNPSNQQCQAMNNGSHGYYASNNSYINAVDSISHHNGHCGYCAEINSTIDVTNSIASENTSHGFSAIRGSTLIAYSSTSHDNNEHGYFASANACIQATGTTQNNGINGIRAENGCVLELSDFAILSNKQGGLSVMSNCVISGDRINSSQNGGDGFHVETNSNLRGNDHRAESNTGCGFVARNLSFINCGGLQSVTNSDQPFIPSVNSDSPGNVGSYIVDYQQHH